MTPWPGNGMPAGAWGALTAAAGRPVVTAAKLRAPERCMEGRGPQGQREAVGEPELAGDRGGGEGCVPKRPGSALVHPLSSWELLASRRG